MTRFGDFEPLCSNVPSYPWCNLFYRQVRLSSLSSNTNPFSPPFPQLLRLSPHSIIGFPNSTLSAPVGVNPQCGIPRVGYDGSIGNVPNIALCGVSIIFVSWLIFLCNRRKAAVGAFCYQYKLLPIPTTYIYRAH